MEIVEGWNIPTIRLNDLTDDVKKLYDKFGQSEVDQETIAQLWGHKSSKSSYFRVHKLGSLRSYGLIEGRGKLRVSDLGKRLIYPKDDIDFMDATVQVMRNIPLWKVLFETFTEKGQSLPLEDLWMDLRRIVGEDKLPPEEAKNKAKIVSKAYFEDIKYYKPENKTETEMKKTETGKVNTSVAKSGVMSVGSLGSGVLSAELVKGLVQEGAYEIAKQFIDFIKARETEKKQDQPHAETTPT